MVICRTLDNTFEATQERDPGVPPKAYLVTLTHPPSYAQEIVFPVSLNVLPYSRGDSPDGGGLIVRVVLSKNDLPPEGGGVMEQPPCKVSM